MAVSAAGQPDPGEGKGMVRNSEQLDDYFGRWGASRVNPAVSPMERSYTQHPLPPSRSAGKSGFVGSGDDLDSYYAAWAQGHERMAGESRARFRRGI